MHSNSLSWLEFSVRYKSYVNVKNISGSFYLVPSNHPATLPARVPVYLLRTPPSNEAFKHSGGDNRLWTSATVTLYLDVELRRDSLPGTEQKTSLGFITAPTNSFWQGRFKGFLVMATGPVNADNKWQSWELHEARGTFQTTKQGWKNSKTNNMAVWGYKLQADFLKSHICQIIESEIHKLTPC